jgi:hypothetical protein
MARPFLTVLTAPVPGSGLRLYQSARRCVRRIARPGAPLPVTSPYPGHYALVRSVVEGLRAIGADFNFNPSAVSEVARVVYAPANEALLQAAEWKRSGRIDYLVAGPVNALFADDAGGVLVRPEIDRLIVAHEWQADFVRGIPDVLAKCRACPCGVDADWWKPSGRPRQRTAVVYWKSGDEAFCAQVEQALRACGLEPQRVRSRHGEHAIFRPEDYRALLDRSIIGVFLSTFETQGLALAEAWSMDVPTVVWDPRGDAVWRGRHFVSRSSAPYLTPATGRLWRPPDALEPVLRGAIADAAAFRPREWVLANMTDAICSAALLAIIREGAATRGAETRRSW